MPAGPSTQHGNGLAGLPPRIAVVCTLAACIARSENIDQELILARNQRLFFSLSEHLRLIVTAKRERDIDYSNNEFGADIELSVRRFRPFCSDM